MARRRRPNAYPLWRPKCLCGTSGLDGGKNRVDWNCPTAFPRKRGQAFAAQPLDLLAPGARFERATDRLTADCSTAELPRISEGPAYTRRASPCKVPLGLNNSSEQPGIGHDQPLGIDLDLPEEVAVEGLVAVAPVRLETGVALRVQGDGQFGE
jgi:hypothetical protein